MDTSSNVVECPTWAERRIIASRYQGFAEGHTVKPAADEQRRAGRSSNLGGAGPSPENETAAPLGRDRGNLSEAVLGSTAAALAAREINHEGQQRALRRP